MKATRTSKFEQAFLDHCREQNFFTENDRVLLAVSGGMDSMALASLMGILKRELNVEIGIAHVNHGLRKKAGDLDQAFVKSFAYAHHYPFFHKKVDVRLTAKSTNTSIEAAARNVRYAFLEKTALQNTYTKICTAHHRSDQAETVLMRIIKGSGLSGLAGIREKRGTLIRPLLIFSREEIRAYVHARKIEYVEDHSNRETVFLRNRIRHQLLPLLKNKFDPQIERHLIQLGLIAGETQILLKHHAEDHFSKVCRVSDGKIVLEIKAFNGYLRAQRQAIIELLFEAHLEQKLQFEDYRRLFELIEKKQSGKCILFGLVRCTKTARQIIFEAKNSDEYAEFCFDVDTDLTYTWSSPAISFQSSVAPNSPQLRRNFGRSPSVEYVDMGKISGHLILRNWKSGDRFMPLGMKNLKRLSDFFIDNKISTLEKKKIPILCERAGKKETVIWVCGMRLDERYKVDKSTHHVLKLECERHEKDH